MKTAFFLTTCLLLAGCLAPNFIVPYGTYTDASGLNWVRISDHHRFTAHFTALDGTDLQPKGRTYDYWCEADGSFYPVTPLSAEAVYGVGRFDYKVSGNEVVVKDRGTGEAMILVRKTSPEIEMKGRR